MPARERKRLKSVGSKEKSARFVWQTYDNGAHQSNESANNSKEGKVRESIAEGERRMF